LQPKEFDLLLALAAMEGRVISAEELYRQVWKTSLGNDKGTLRKHISSVRSKLKKAHADYTISNIYGTGYCFEKD